MRTANKDTSDQGSAIKDRVSPLRGGGVITPNADRNQTPFASAPRQVFQVPPQGSDYHQPQNLPPIGAIQNNYMGSGYPRSDDRFYGNYENQPSDRNRPFNIPSQGMTFGGTSRGSIPGHPGSFDQTQQLDHLAPRGVPVE